MSAVCVSVHVCVGVGGDYHNDLAVVKLRERLMVQINNHESGMIYELKGYHIEEVRSFGANGTSRQAKSLAAAAGSFLQRHHRVRH